MNKKPEAMKDKIDQIWDDVRGTNGHGLITLVRKNSESIEHLSEDVAYIKGKIDSQLNVVPEAHSSPSVKIITIRRMIEIVLGFAIVAFVSWLFLSIWLGKVSIAEAAGLIEAIRGASGQ